jgi:hypothetical protein
MKTPLTIAFPKSRPSPWLEAEIRARVERLELVCPDLLACRVVVDIPHRHHQRGNRFALRIELSVPGEELAVTRTRRDIRLVTGDAFDVARRKLSDYAQVRRREVKRHEAPARSFLEAAGEPWG